MSATCIVSRTYSLEYTGRDLHPICGLCSLPTGSFTCRGSSDAVGFLIRSWNASGDGGAAIVYDFNDHRLEAIFEGEADIGSQATLDDTQDHQRRIGGDVDMRPGDKLTVGFSTLDCMQNL